MRLAELSGELQRRIALRPALAAQGLCVRREEDWTDRVAPTLAVDEQLRRELLVTAASLIAGYARR